MAFTPDITVKDSANADVIYSFITSAGSKTIRRDSSRPLETPRIFTVSHESAGKGITAVDRHMAKFDQTELDGDDVTTATGSVHIVLTVPRKVITATHVQDLVAQLKSYLTTENVTKLLTGTPG